MDARARITKKHIMVKVARLLREDGATGIPDLFPLKKAVTPTEYPVAEDDVQAKKKSEAYDKAFKEFATTADKHLDGVRKMMEAEAKSLGIDAVVDVYKTLQEFEYALRRVAYKKARKAAGEAG